MSNDDNRSGSPQDEDVRLPEFEEIEPEHLRTVDDEDGPEHDDEADDSENVAEETAPDTGSEATDGAMDGADPPEGVPPTPSEPGSDSVAEDQEQDGEMQRAAFQEEEAGDDVEIPTEDTPYYLFHSDSTEFHEVSATSPETTPQVTNLPSLRGELADFNKIDIKAFILMYGTDEALVKARDEFDRLNSEINRASAIAEYGMMALGLDLAMGAQKLRAICRECGFDFKVRVEDQLRHISFRSFQDYERMLRYADIYGILGLGKNRSLSLIAVMEKDAGKGKKKRNAWEGDTPIKDYLAKHGIQLPAQGNDPGLVAFRYTVDVLINKRRIKKNDMDIPDSLVRQFTSECGELKRAALDDLKPLSGNLTALKERLAEYQKNSGKVPKSDAGRDRMKRIIEMLDEILKDDDLGEEVTQESVSTLRAKVARLALKVAPAA